MSRPRQRIGLRDALFAGYLVIGLAAQIWPAYAVFGNSIEPYVLGVPFALAWVVAWVLATFVALGLYHLSGSREGGGRDATEG